MEHFFSDHAAQLYKLVVFFFISSRRLHCPLRTKTVDNESLHAVSLSNCAMLRHPTTKKSPADKFLPLKNTPTPNDKEIGDRASPLGEVSYSPPRVYSSPSASFFLLHFFPMLLMKKKKRSRYAPSCKNRGEREKSKSRQKKKEKKYHTYTSSCLRRIVHFTCENERSVEQARKMCY